MHLSRCVNRTHGLLDWLNATLKNGFDKTAGDRVTFCVAFVLNLLSLATYRLHWNPEHVARYGFLFAIPWAWILDGLFVSIHSRCSPRCTDTQYCLWVPALCIQPCLWLCSGNPSLCDSPEETAKSDKRVPVMWSPPKTLGRLPHFPGLSRMPP